MAIERLKASRSLGFEVGVELSGDLQQYALDFLHIFNNVKSDNDLIRVWNDYGKIVYVVCRENAHSPLIEYLAQFGKIVHDDPVEIMTIGDGFMIEYDTNKFTDLILDPNID